MDLHVLGAGPAYSDRVGALGAGYLLTDDGRSLLLDLGQGVFPSLAAALEPSALGAVIVSHLHPDHFIDLVPLRHYLRYEFDPPRRVPVVAPAGLAERLDALNGELGFCRDVLALTDLTVGAFECAGFRVEARRVTHTQNSHAVRVGDPGRPGLVYSGDCGEWRDLVPLVRPGDVLLTEVSFGDGPVPVGALHLDAASVGELALATRPALVLLTHLQMGFDRAATLAGVRARYGGEVRFVSPGDRLVV